MRNDRPSLTTQPSRWPTALAGLAAAAALASTLATVPSHAADRAVTAQQRGTAQQVASSGIALSELAPNAPDSYTVRVGDTLWDLSKMYLTTPWRWPELWGMNMDQVRNPHLIYPGQVLVLDKRNGRARLSVAQGADGSGSASGPGGTVRLSPRVRATDAGDPITAVSMHLIAPFMQEMGVFNTDDLMNAPRIVAAKDERVLIGKGEPAYVVGNVDGIRNWSVFRSATPLLDPRTRELLGYEARLLGAAEYVRAGEVRTVSKKETQLIPATFSMTTVRSEIRAGDRLMPKADADLTTFMPHAPTKYMQGQIVSVYGDGLIAGQNQIVSLNRGAADGVERGNVLAVLRDGRLITDRTGADGRPVQLKLPDERHGLMLVFRVFDRVSYALMLNVQQEVRAGDHFTTP